MTDEQLAEIRSGVMYRAMRPHEFHEPVEELALLAEIDRLRGERPILVEPEAVWHDDCPTMTETTVVPLMQLSSSTDDSAGHKRRYVCEACAHMVVIHFPPVAPCTPTKSAP